MWLDEKLSPTKIKRIVKLFRESQQSAHSKLGRTLAAEIRYCEENGLSYRLTARPGLGYFIEVIPSIDPYEKYGPCDVVGPNCTHADEPVRTRCFGCGNNVCKDCSSIRRWYTYGKNRICDRCVEEHSSHETL